MCNRRNRPLRPCGQGTELRLHRLSLILQTMHFLTFECGCLEWDLHRLSLRRDRAHGVPREDLTGVRELPLRRGRCVCHGQLRDRLGRWTNVIANLLSYQSTGNQPCDQPEAASLFPLRLDQPRRKSTIGVFGVAPAERYAAWNIPKPTRSHWAKRAAGRKVKRPPVPVGDRPKKKPAAPLVTCSGAFSDRRGALAAAREDDGPRVSRCLCGCLGTTRRAWPLPHVTGRGGFSEGASEGDDPLVTTSVERPVPPMNRGEGHRGLEFSAIRRAPFGTFVVRC